MYKKRYKGTIVTLLKEHKVTNKELAKSLGVTPVWVSRLLSRPTEDLTVRQLRAIANAIGYELSISLDIKLL